jgi:hypothetical protein
MMAQVDSAPARDSRRLRTAWRVLLRASMKKLSIFALALIACGGTTVDNTQDAGGDGSNNNNKDSATGADGGGRVPKNHRATATACPSGRGSEESQIPDAGQLGSCAKDSDCTQGTNGRCTWSNGGAHVLSCTYDQCASDSDCSGTVCVCRPDATSTDQNFCGSSKSNCRVDADCGAGGFCSPSESSDTFCFSADSAYYCHTSSDECIDDSDCGNPGSCNYDTTAKHWKCGSICAPPPP